MRPGDQPGFLSREQALDIIDREVSDLEGVAGLLTRLCCGLKARLDLVGAAVTLLPSVGSHSVVAASSPTTVRIEALQFDSAEGPTLEAYDGGRPVLIGDLGQQHARWPGLVPAAIAAGVCAVFSFPLLVGATRFGALTLYWPEPQQPEPQILRTALVFADLATEFLIDNSSSDAAEGLDPVLGPALETHGHIYQAQGMVMVDLGVGLLEALARMRAHAYATGQDLADLATEIITGTTVLTRDPKP